MVAFRAVFPSRRAPRQLLLLLLTCLSFLTRPAEAATVADERPISHVVIIWLKNPGHLQNEHALIAASKSFRRIRGVTRVEVGRALPSRRRGIEQSFDLAVLITFRNRKALERYENHPRHLLAVQQVLRPLAKRYVVYNSALQ